MASLCTISISKMLALVLAVYALAAPARGDCSACVAGLCHVRSPIVSGFVSDQLAIDQKHNVLYLVLNGNQNTAIFLDGFQIQMFLEMKTNAMAVDQENSILYLGTEVENTFYMYYLLSNVTEAVQVESNKTSAKFMYCTDFRLYFIDDTGVLIYNTPYRQIDIDIDTSFLDSFIEQDFAKLYLTNDNGYYHFPRVSSHDFLEKITKNVPAVDTHNHVYFGNATENLIYKRNELTNNLEIYASYTTPPIQRFVFDKNNRIIFRDAEGIARWVPAPGHRRCAVDPPHEGFVIRQIPDEADPDN